jgi:uncharacterized membrane protein YagU involved in acid resistance
MKSQSFVRALEAGFAGTVAMTAFAFMGPFMGMPKMSAQDMLAGFMGVPTIIGWLAHLMIGSVLALLYVYVVAEKMPGKPWVQGALFGLIPWLLLQVMVNPMMGAGVFAANTPAPMRMIVGSLMGHLVYGGVLGAVYGRGGHDTSIPVPQV